jgi:hypothetical protein
MQQRTRSGLNGMVSFASLAPITSAAAHSPHCTLFLSLSGWQLSDRWTIKAVSARFCPTCGLGFKDDGGQSILFHFSNSHAHLHTVEALEAQTALYNYSYALQAYEQACYEQQQQQQQDLKEVNAVATVSCNASSTSSSTPRIARDDSSANSEDLEGAAAFKLVQEIEKSDRPKHVVKKKPTSASTKPIAAPKPTPTFDLKSVPYDSAFPSLGGSDAASNAPMSWAKRPAVASSRKLDVTAPLYTPGTIATAFSSLAVKERREADMPVNPSPVDQSQAVQVANKEVAEAVESKAVVSQEGAGGKKDKRDKKTPGPGHQERRGRGRGPAADHNKAPARSNADDQDSWRKVTANGKAK